MNFGNRWLFKQFKLNYSKWVGFLFTPRMTLSKSNTQFPWHYSWKLNLSMNHWIWMNEINGNCSGENGFAIIFIWISTYNKNTQARVFFSSSHYGVVLIDPLNHQISRKEIVQCPRNLLTSHPIESEYILWYFKCKMR